MFYFGVLFCLFVLSFGGGFLGLSGMMSRRSRFSEKETLSSYECGFQPMCNVRIPFSLQFYLVAIIFLLFDIELVLILPYLSDWCSNVSGFLFFFFFILLIGLIHEMNEGSFDWRKHK